MLFPTFRRLAFAILAGSLALPAIAPASPAFTLLSPTSAKTTSQQKLFRIHYAVPPATQALPPGAHQLLIPQDLAAQDEDLARMAAATRPSLPAGSRAQSCLLALPPGGASSWSLNLSAPHNKTIASADLKQAVSVEEAWIGTLPVLQVIIDPEALPAGVTALEVEVIANTSNVSQKGNVPVSPLSDFPSLQRLVETTVLNADDVQTIALQSATAAAKGLPSLPEVPGTLRISYRKGREILRVPLSSLGITAAEVGEMRFVHHGTVLPLGGVIGTDAWFFAPRRTTTTDINDAIFATRDAASPSPAMATRPAFSTLTPAGTEVAAMRDRNFDLNLIYERGSILPNGQRFVYWRINAGQTRTQPLPIYDRLTDPSVSMTVTNLGHFTGESQHIAMYGLQGQTSPTAAQWAPRTQSITAHTINITLPNPSSLTFSHFVPSTWPLSGGTTRSAGDTQMLDSVHLLWTGYPRVDTANTTELIIFPPDTPTRYTVGGLPTGTTAADVMVLDITDANAPVLLTSPVVFTDSDGTVGVEWEAAPGSNRYLVQRIGNLTTASAVATETLPALPTSEPLRAIYVRDPQYASDLLPLFTMLGGTGGIIQLNPQAAYNTYNGGQESPEALRQALAGLLAAAPSRIPLPSVILVGHGSFDRRNYLNTHGSVPQIPVFIRNSVPSGGISIENCEDFDYALLEGGDNFEDVILARLPVKTSADLTRIVNRAIAHNAQKEALRALPRKALFVTDDDLEFVNDAPQILARWTPTGRDAVSVQIINGNGAPARTAIKNALEGADGGIAFTLYTGHGNINNWAAENVLNVTDVPNIDTLNKWPMVTTFTCLNAAYAIPGSSTLTLAEALLVSSDRGAIADIAPCTVDFYFEQRTFSEQVLDAVANNGNRPQTAGELLHRARTSYLTNYPAFLTTARIYLLFGDPSADLTLPLATRVEGWSEIED